MNRPPLAILLVIAAAGCAGAYNAAGPGASQIKRRRADQFVETGRSTTGNTTTVYGYRVPGGLTIGGEGFGVSLGTKLGLTRATLSGRDAEIGIGSEPHADLVYLPKSDRWSLTATFGWVFQTIDFDGDTVTYHGPTPSLSVHVAIIRALYAHAGVGYSFGSFKLSGAGAAPDGQEDAGQKRLLFGVSHLWRRTPRIDLVFRLEGNAYFTDDVALPSGSHDGTGLTFQAIWSSF